MSSPTPISALVRPIMAGIPKPEGPIPELGPREPAPRVFPEGRDELRNQWMNYFHTALYEEANPSKESRDFFAGRNTLNFTLKASGGDMFPQVHSGDHLDACSAFYSHHGWIHLWSQKHGTGKSTYALWHVLRHLRLMAEERADKEATCTSFSRHLQPAPVVVFDAWPRCVMEMKSQIGRNTKEATLPRLKAADMLVLENIGPMTNYEGNLLEELLGHRYSMQKRTIICTRAAKNIQEVEDDFLGPRVMSFIAQRGRSVFVDGPSRRDPDVRTSTVTPL